MSKLTESQYPVYFKPYIEILGADLKSIDAHLENSLDKALILLTNISEEKQQYRYADGKWTIKELIQHLIDTERIFVYRALVFARNDTTVLPGFNENDYVLHSNSNSRSYQDLITEFKSVRNSTILFFKSLTDPDLGKIGTISNNVMSVRSLGYITSGHLLHHLKIIEQKYLV